MSPSSTQVVVYQDGWSSDSRKATTLCDTFQTPRSPQINRLVKGDVLGALLTSWGPNLLSTTLLGHLRTRPQNASAFTVAINVIKAQFILFRRRIDTLEAENDDLKHDNMMYHSDVGGLESELTNLRADYYSELFQRRLDTRHAKEDKEEIKTLKAELMTQRTEVMILKDKNAQYDNFIQALVDLKLNDPVFQAAYQSVKDGCDTEDAIIDAVMKASTQKGSAWSRIIPAVVGPRSPEHYLSAIDLALKARKDLYERQKASGFWKLKAMADPSNVDVITPSPSQISEICDQLIQRQVGPMEKENLALRDTTTPEQKLDIVVDLAPTVKLTHTLLATATCEISRRVTPLDFDSSINFKETLATSNSLESVPEEDMDQTYLSSGRESVVSVETLKAVPAVQDEHADDEVLDACSQVHEHVDTERKSDGNKDGLLKPIQESIERALPPSTDEIYFDLEPSTPTKSSGSYSLPPTIYAPTMPLRINSRSRPPVSPNFSTTAASLSKSRLTEHHTKARPNPELFVAPVKSLSPTSPNRSRLTTPRGQTIEHHVPQSTSLNVPPTSCDDKENIDPNCEIGVEGSQNLRRSSARNFRKRRGVIMVERVEVGPKSVVKDTSSASPKRSHSNIPEYPCDVSDDVFSAPSSQNIKSLENRIVKKDEKEACGWDSKKSQPDDICLSPSNHSDFAPPSQTCDTAPSSKMTGLLQPSEIAVHRAPIPSPTSLIVSRLIENFSDSDLGSLEMTEDEDSDSDCEHIRRVQNELDELPMDLSNLPHIRQASAQEVTRAKAARCSREERGLPGSEGDDGDDGDFGLSTSVSTTAVVSALSPSVAASPSIVSTSRSSRPPTPFSRKSLSWTSNRKDDAALSASTSDSSYATSSGSGSDSQPSKSKRISRLPLFGLARRFARGSTSPTPTMQNKNMSNPPTHIRTPSPTTSRNENAPTTPRNEIKKNSSGSTFSTPQSTTYKPFNNLWSARSGSSKITGRDTTVVTPTKPISSPKPLSKANSTQQQTPPATTPTPTPTPKTSAGQRLMHRLSNVPIPKPRSIPQPTKTSPTYLAPPTSFGQYTKPRSHTINTVSPLPPSLSTPSPQSLMAGSTKPRSHTVNTYSPTTRSPLSRLAGGSSSADKNTPTKASRAMPGSSLPSPSLQRSLAPKSVPSNKTTVKNTTLPLRVNKSSSKNQPTSHDSDFKPPTAAFMRPAATTSSTTKRMTNSIAPLIPNWTPSATNNTLPPKQCRSMFRNSLSMVVR